jgi:hypothetical protein
VLAGVLADSLFALLGSGTGGTLGVSAVGFDSAQGDPGLRGTFSTRRRGASAKCIGD